MLCMQLSQVFSLAIRPYLRKLPESRTVSVPVGRMAAERLQRIAETLPGQFNENVN